jgi:hypothetical protein
VGALVGVGAGALAGADVDAAAGALPRAAAGFAGGASCGADVHAERPAASKPASAKTLTTAPIAAGAFGEGEESSTFPLIMHSPQRRNLTILEA